MNKKQYQKPSITVVPVQMSQMLCMSNGVNDVRGNDGFRFRSGGFDDDDADY